MLYIDQFVYKNRMRHSHPLEKVIFAFATILLSVVTDKIAVHLAVMTVMLSLLVFKAGIPANVVGKLLLGPGGFLLAGVLVLAVTVHVSAAGMLVALPLGNLYLGVTVASLALAASTLFRSLSAVSALYFLILTTPMTDLLYVLQLLRLPAIVIELGMLVYRFIFVFLETAFSIYAAQSARLGFIDFRRSITSFGLLFAHLWGKAFFKSQALYNSLLSRGYGGELKVLSPEYKFSLTNTLLFVLLELGLITLAFVV
ncbi:MAG: cobalt ECF transporter T component CbiQ [Firmicutes bacterium]|nr:cobalt ECF transporter T component CbiQ [Bacillota bacterium]